MSFAFIVAGLMMTFTPALMALRECGGEVEDFIRWMMGQPLGRLIAFSFCTASGVGLVWVGLATGFRP